MQTMQLSRVPDGSVFYTGQGARYEVLSRRNDLFVSVQGPLGSKTQSVIQMPSYVPVNVIEEEYDRAMSEVIEATPSTEVTETAVQLEEGQKYVRDLPPNSVAQNVLKNRDFRVLRQYPTSDVTVVVMLNQPEQFKPFTVKNDTPCWPTTIAPEDTKPASTDLLTKASNAENADDESLKPLYEGTFNAETPRAPRGRKPKEVDPNAPPKAPRQPAPTAEVAPEGYDIDAVELARLLGVNNLVITYRARNNQLPGALKVGSKWMFKSADFGPDYKLELAVEDRWLRKDASGNTIPPESIQSILAERAAAAAEVEAKAKAAKKAEKETATAASA